MKVRDLLLFVLLVVFLPCFALAGPARITIDGDFSDWQDIEPIYSDASGDQISGSIDLGRLWVANDKENLFISIEVGAEINFQEGNSITLYIDSDRRPWSGIFVPGIGRRMGTDLEWTFGERRGYRGDHFRRYEIRHADIGFVAAPTVTSSRFEMSIPIPGTRFPAMKVFTSRDMSLVFLDKDGGDRLPDEGILEFTVTAKAPPLLPPTSLAKDEGSHLRLMSYNVLSNGLFYSPSGACQERIIQAIRPDVIGLQEIYGHAAEETRDVIAEMLPDDPDGSAIEWQASAVESDIVVVSRYPIIDTFPIGGNGAFLIDPGEAYEKDLFLIVAHLPCCGSNEGRQREIDEIMAFIREAKEPGGVLDLHPGTPIVIMGDLNLVGYNQQLETLLTGDIVNTEDHGPAFTPDWDGTDLTDLLPIHTHLPMAYTWYNDNAYYWPGRLDYIIYSDSAAEPAKSFVLWTDAMPTRTLLDYGLEKGDTDRASDHLPVVCDLIVE